MDSLIGQTLDGRYLVESRIGQGAMGAVYKARHIAMAQPVALKFLLTDQATDPSMVQRFIREARQSFHIDHPNCVRVTDFCATEDGTLFIVMDYLDGRTVGRDISVDGPLSSARVRHIGAQAADALGHAHSLGIVHRDLKPDNMMLLQRGDDCDFTKVFDFGLAKLFDQGMVLTGLSMSPLTQDGIVFGTPVYMAPEQALGGDIGPPADIYTLGVCCYEMLTGSVPFEGTTFTAILSMHVQKEPQAPSARRPDLLIDAQLEELVMRCLHKEAAKRPTASQLAHAFRGTPLASPADTPDALTSSETLVLQHSEVPELAAAAAQGANSGSGAEANNAGFSTVSVAADPQVFRRPKYHYALLALPMVALVAIVIASAGGSSSEAPTDEAPKVGEPPQSVVHSEPGAANTGPAALDAGTAAVAKPAFDAAPKAATKPQQPNARVHAKPNPHLHAAEAAFRSGKTLKQLTEANAVLEKEPRNRRAAYLAGDALLKSGDKVRACRFFRRSSRKHYRANGCEN